MSFTGHSQLPGCGSAGSQGFNGRAPLLKPQPWQPGSDSSRWLTVTILFWLVIKYQIHTALCTNTWGYCWLLCISGFYFESRWSFLGRTLPEGEATPGVCLKHLLRFVQVRVSFLSFFQSGFNTSFFQVKASDRLPLNWGWGREFWSPLIKTIRDTPKLKD